MEYLDFEIEVGAGAGREFAVSLLHSPAGEARGNMLLPFDELALESRLKDLQIALLRSGGMRDARRAGPGSPKEEGSVRDMGQSLFDALVSGEIRNRYDVSQQIAVREGKGLRLKLRFQSPELATLPWEYLFDSRQAEYICLSSETPVVRYIELPMPVQAMTITPPLRVLGMIASPSDLENLDTDREKKRVERALKGLIDRGVLELTWLEGQTWRDLQRALRTGTWHVFHFIGHGGFDPTSDEGFIALADDQGRTHQLSASQLGRLLADHNPLRLALLNSCEGSRGGSGELFSSTASILVRRGLPAVLAMQYEISDRAAIEFSRSFYEALADGIPVDAAVSEARKAISLAIAHTVEWGTPTLFMRAADGVLFSVEEGARIARPSAPPPQTAAPAPETGPAEAPSRPSAAAAPPARKIPVWALGLGGLVALALIAGGIYAATGGFGRQAQPTQSVVAIVEASATTRPTEAPTPNGTATALAAAPAATPTPAASPTEPPPTKQQVRSLAGPLDTITSAAWSQNGALLAVGSLDGTVRVWSAPDFAAPTALPGHTGGVLSLAWSKDGTRLATAARDGTIHLWDTTTWNEFKQFKQEGEVTGMSWSPDGATLIVAHNGFNLQLWDAVAGEKTIFFGSSAVLTSVSWFGDKLVTAASDRYVRIWNAKTGAATTLPPEHTATVLSVAWSPDGASIASGSEDAVIWLWDAIERKSIRALRGHTGPVRSLSWSVDGQTVASASDDGTVRLWDVASGEMSRLLESNAGPSPVVAFSPTNANLLAVSSQNRNGEYIVDVWDLSVP